ncbi:hypothetical protein LX36DRAFT_587537, partial [Colletotrichum falcatum]
KTYNTRYSLVVTDPTTNPALTGLSMGERTGSRVLRWVWSYVPVPRSEPEHIATGDFMCPRCCPSLPRRCDPRWVMFFYPDSV